MLTNVISTGTWPPKHIDAKISKKGPSFICEQKTSLLKKDKKPRYKHDHTKIALFFTEAENHWSKSKPAEYNTEKNIHNDIAVKGRKISNESLGKETLNVCSKQLNINTTQESPYHCPCAISKISKDILGISVDSNVSSIDVFESFDTVSEVSTLSQFSETEKIEHFFSDLPSVKTVQNSSVENFMVYNEAELLMQHPYDKICYDFAHGSFGNISLSEPRDRFKAYGIRDLKSENNLNDLKEHLLCAERNKDPQGISANHSSVLENRYGYRLSSGYTFLEKTRKATPGNQSKAFLSLQNIDSEAMAMSYFESLRYLKQRDNSCRASGPGLKDGIVGTKTTFYIFSDKDNAKLLKVYVTGPRLMPPKMEFDYLAEGFYAITYLPDRVGWYTVNVLWKGKHIAGSPFDVLKLLPQRKVWIKRSDLPQAL